MSDKSRIQFWVAIISTVALACITLASIGRDWSSGSEASSLTMVLAGALVSLSSMTAGWLFPRVATPAEPDAKSPPGPPQ